MTTIEMLSELRRRGYGLPEYSIRGLRNGGVVLAVSAMKPERNPATSDVEDPAESPDMVQEKRSVGANQIDVLALHEQQLFDRVMHVFQ